MDSTSSSNSMSYTSSTNLMVLLVIILVIVYFFEKKIDNFDPNLTQSYEPVNYNTRKQNCNELTYSPDKCYVETVIPENKIVCGDNLTPITNNQKECKKSKKDTSKNSDISKRPSVSLQYDFDLLSSFNGAQIDNTKTNNDLMTDVRSLNSLENDLISNY